MEWQCILNMMKMVSVNLHFSKCRECLNCGKTRSVTYTRTAARPPLAVDPDVPVAVVVLRSYGNKRCQRAVMCITRA